MFTHAIVIPCYNEASRLKIDLFRQFIEERKEVALCFVNDGSTDNTPAIIALLKDHYPNQVHVVNNANNEGKSEAVRKGILYALSNLSVPFLGFIDADLSTSLDEYARMMNIIARENGLMVYASRVKHKGNQIVYTPFRRWAGRIGRGIIKYIIRLPIRDTQCGAKIYSRPVALSCFEQPFETRWLFDVEIFLRIKKQKPNAEAFAGVIEYNLEKWVFQPHSKLTLRDALYTPYEFIKIIWRYRNYISG